VKYFKLTRAALDGLNEALDAVAEHGEGRELYIAIDDDTLKLKVGHGMWSIPFDLEPHGRSEGDSEFRRVLPSSTQTWDSTDLEKREVEALMDEGPWPIYGHRDLLKALRRGYELGRENGVVTEGPKTPEHREGEPVERIERKIVEHISDPERNQHGIPYRWVYFTDGTSAPTWPNGSINEILAQYENYIGNEVEISFYAGLITNMEVW
jgi:hypothetical protein